MWIHVLFLPEREGTYAQRKYQKCFTGIFKVIHRHNSHGLWLNLSPTGDHPPGVEQNATEDYSKKMTKNFKCKLLYLKQLKII